MSQPDSAQQPEAGESGMESLEEARMSILEHLTELRQRLIYSTIAIFIGFVAAWMFKEDIFNQLLMPLQLAAEQSNKGTIELAQMHHKDLAEPFFALLKTSIMAGIFLAAPVALYNLWRFISPGLYDSEKKVAIPFVMMATVFFYGGASFCYFGVLPYGYLFLLDFGSAAASDPALMMNEYLSLTTKLMVVFGVVFELPVLAMFLSAIGLITHHTLIKYWRAAVIGSFVTGAILTPADPMTQIMLAVPLCVLYAISIGVAWVFTKRRGEDDETALEPTDDA